MNLGSLAIAFLVGLSGILGVSNLPKTNDLGWTVQTEWNAEGDAYVLRAESEKIVEACKADPTMIIEFPMIIHSAHEIFLDGVKIAESGDPKFEGVHSFYGSPQLRCSKVALGKKLGWTAYSYTRYFARIQSYPSLGKYSPVHLLLSETLNAIAAGALLILSIFTAAIFRGKVAERLWISLTLSSLFFAIYFCNVVPVLFGISVSMLTAHKIADVGLWIGTGFYFYSLRAYGICDARLYRIYLGFLASAIVIVLFASTGDGVQFGTTIPFMATPVVLISCALALYRRLKTNGYDPRSVFAFISLGFFFVTSFNDILVIVGLSAGYMMLSFGFIAGMFFFALAINEQISTVYRERDFLNTNLESEVARKTDELRGKTTALEKAMVELKSTQAELVHSAKLASLGTLSAGIAHEINNSLNFVYGSVKPLENLVEKATGMADEQKEKAKKLLFVMGDGLRLTFEIIKSLRNFTGLNQAKLNDMDLREVISTVLVILRNRTKNFVKVQVDVEDGAKVYGNVVGLNQVFMNLFSNAIDAMPTGGDLRISSSRDNGHVVIQVTDSGSGIPKEAMERIFDPFFTTKDVGKGTGLGLHIVRQEIERHHGSIRCESEAGKGTSFFISLPLSQEQFLKEAA